MRNAVYDCMDEFEVFYQPVMDVSKDDNPCIGAEALVRWDSSEFGIIMPDDFIPLAEYLGVINPIGEHVLSEAVVRCKYWNDSGYPDYKIGINVSMIQLLQPDFAAKVKQLLERTGINPKNVILEVTEKLAITDMQRMQEVLARLKKLGVRIALDDFGTGYSSLNHMKELPIDIIKIDPCIVKNLGEEDFAAVFVKMTAELAKTIGVSVCVEGVEQLRQTKIVKELPVELAQGFYYGRPMSSKEYEKVFCSSLFAN